MPPSIPPAVALALIAGLLLSGCTTTQPSHGAAGRDPQQWKPHDESRPKPTKVEPGPYTAPIRPPSDALVLFDGSDFSKWQKGDGGEPGWKIDGNAMKVVPDSGDIYTKQTFGDCQLYVEWMAHPDASGEGQHRSNSGVFFGDQYEIQVLDNYDNPTYADGYAGAVYGQYPPLVNACRPAERWQTYQIIYRRPHFDDDGNVTEPAYITVFHNGVLVQDHVPLTGPTAHKKRPPYQEHGELAIHLQDHGDNPMWFRNVWVRELE